MWHLVRAALCGLTLCAALPSHATVIRVLASAPGAAHDGGTWQTAFTKVEDALAAAKSGDEIWVGPGRYAVNNRATAPIAVPPGAGLYGGFNGTETVRDDADRRATRTTLTTPYGRGLILSFASGAGPDTVVDGFTIRGAGDNTVTGAVQCKDASPTLSHNIFRQSVARNRLGQDGVFIACQGGAPVIANNIFTEAPSDVMTLNGSGGRIVNNTIAANGGAAVYITGNAAPVVANNILANNVWGVKVYKAPVPETRNNCAFGNPGGDYAGMPDPTGQDGNITADPGFMNAAYGYRHIRPGSPCVDAGNDNDVVGERDVDFQPRVVGAHVDIGADEGIEPAWPFIPPVVRVSPDGDDANDGSAWAKAKKTIQAAIDAAASAGGGEVWVAAGEYAPEHVLGVLEDTFNLPAYVYLYGGFAGRETERKQRDWSRNLTTLVNTPSSNSVLLATSGHGVSAVDGFRFVVTDRHRGFAGADIEGRGASPIMRHNTFGGGVRPTGQSAVFIGGGLPDVSDNVFEGIGGSGVLVFGRCAPAVRRNVFRKNPAAIGTIKGISCPTAEVTDNLFDGNTGSQGIVTVEYAARSIGNTFVNNKAYSPGYGPTFWGSVFINNVVANNDFQLAGSYAPDPAMRFNNFWKSGPTNNTVPGNGNIAADPLFVDAAAGDYRLSHDSPSIDAGDDSVAAADTVDLDGQPRIRGRHVDMGAYESAFTSAIPHVFDVVNALRIAGGLRAATAGDVDWLDAAPDKGITVEDALTVLRTVQG